jgi:hypothetical protein
METQNVSLTISKEIVQPIVQAKINEAILAAMGGQDQLIEKAIQNILYQKVNNEGKVSTYSNDNKHSWIDIVVTKQIEEAVKASLALLLSEKRDQMQQAILKQLSSKKGIESFAAALIDSTTKLQDRYYSTVAVTINPK